MKYKSKMRKERRGRKRRKMRNKDKGGSQRKKYSMDGEKK